MASKRMLSRSISVSKQVNQLSLKGKLIFTWCIPWLDDFGRIDKDPEVVKALVFPLCKEVTADDISFFFDAAKRLKDGFGATLLQETNDCYEYTGFSSYQYLNKMTPSKFQAQRDGVPTVLASSYEDPKEIEKTNTVSEIFDGYDKIFPDHKIKARNRDRTDKIKTRLKTFTKDEILESFANASQNKFMTGDNDGNSFYATIDYLTKNDANLEKWLNHKPNGGTPLTQSYYIGNKKVSKEEWEEHNANN